MCRKVWVATKPSLVGHDFSHGVHPTVVGIHGMDKGCRPVAGRETWSVKEWACGEGECLVPTFCTHILGGAIGAHRLDSIKYWWWRKTSVQKVALQAYFPPKLVQITLPWEEPCSVKKSQVKSTGVKEYAQVEGVSVKFGVALESTSDLSQKNWVSEMAELLWESFVQFCEVSQRLCTGRNCDWHTPGACWYLYQGTCLRSLVSTHFCGLFHHNSGPLRLLLVTDHK